MTAGRYVNAPIFCTCAPAALDNTIAPMPGDAAAASRTTTSESLCDTIVSTSTPATVTL